MKNDMTRQNSVAFCIMKHYVIFLPADSQGRAQVRADRWAAPTHNKARTPRNTEPHPAVVPPGVGVSSERDGPGVHQPPGTLCVTDILNTIHRAPGSHSVCLSSMERTDFT